MTSPYCGKSGGQKRTAISHIIAGILCVAVATQPSFAQSSVDEETLTLEEIVVTARLKEESIQDVPISITNISSETLSEANVIDIQDLIFLTPGLSSSSPFGRINASPSIRGLVNAGLGEEQTVGFFLDGVYISGRTGLNGTYFGLERVEVSKGPQGALYGRNSFAGAVNYVTKRPTEEFEGQLRVSGGSDEYSQALVELSGPIAGDTLLARGGIFYQKYGSEFTNSVPDGPDIGGNESTSALGSLLWQPSDSSKVYFKAIYTEDIDDAPPFFLAPANSQPSPTSGFPRYYEGRLPETGPGFFANSEHQGVERETLRLSLNADFDISEALVLQSLTGYNEQEGFYDFDADYTALFFNRTFEEFDKSDFSQELRLSNFRSNAPIQWLVGASYYDFDDDLLARSHLPGFGQPLGDGVLNQSGTESIGVFGSVSANVNEQLNLTAELRYNDEEKTLLRPGFDLQSDWQEWIPRLTASYQPQDNRHWYGSIARGFKTGGFNTFANLFPEERVYEPETNWTYEIGFKTSNDSRSFTLNTSVFYIDVSDQQVIGLSAADVSSNQFTDNAAESSSKGVELEATWRTDVGLDFILGYAYADPKFDNFLDPDLNGLPIGPDVSGNQINRTSKHQLNLTARYESGNEVLAGMRWFARADFGYQSSQFSVPANLARTGSVENLNVRFGLRNDRYSLAFWGRNVTDDRTPFAGVRWFDASGTYTNLPPFQRAFLVTAREGSRFGATFEMDF